MNKTSLSRVLLLAGLVAAGGVAQAQTIVESTTTPAPGHVVTTTTYYSPATVVTYPAPAVVHNNADTVVTEVHRAEVVNPYASAATFDAPTRAGEASTMTGGAPNMVTDNDRVILGSNSPVLVIH
jgi:hypothetical protein